MAKRKRRKHKSTKHYYKADTGWRRYYRTRPLKYWPAITDHGDLPFFADASGWMNHEYVGKFR